MTLLVTSARQGEGKTLTAANLAASFAQTGKRTILVDADLRQPEVHVLFQMPNDIGLTSLFLAEAVASGQLPSAQASEEKLRGRSANSNLKSRLEASLLPTETPGLYVLPSGPVPPNPSEILASAKMDQMLRTLQRLADVVILDSPPVLPVADAAVLAAKGVGVVLVVEAGKTRSQVAIMAKQTLILGQARILGVILNKLPGRAVGYYGYRYYPSSPKGPYRLTGFLRRILAGLRAGPNARLRGRSEAAAPGTRGFPDHSQASPAAMPSSAIDPAVSANVNKGPDSAAETAKYIG